ncbi:MutR family transcriptional regulator [Enterococcus silesiacus]|uniref:MutR family transcriptional regulator n=1 Tax=Enterococcus silesiacus TaxID=332949 RepID=A0A0S3KBW1_9ENTE|nr:Rgg/GadR/MutR family transcriptional regulator [Enterococcus silesiacus]ALS01714.1 MutR family transcriptional regulator [Enterococcus silesiacus]OJG87524.1 transcriptional activator, Rgg/GadR/MutR family domain-containing protein [Enterococcus silesiacus]
MKDYGTLIKKIRLEKGLSQKNIYEGIMTRQTYYLIETNVSMPSFDKFLMILEKLFISVDEFLYLVDPEMCPTEMQLYHQLSEAVFKKDQKMLDFLTEKSQQLYSLSNKQHYFHLNLITQAMSYLNKVPVEPESINFLNELMQPIKQYLIGIDKWYLYELKLLNNSLYCFELSEAIALGTLVGKKIDVLSDLEQYQDIKLRIYLNLSSLCLNCQDYENTLFFSTLAKENAQNNYRLFETIIAKLNYEIAQTASLKQSENRQITHYLTILEDLDYKETVLEYQKILKSNAIYY